MTKTFFQKQTTATFFRLIRWPNLAIIFLTQLLVWACVLLPFARNTRQSLFLTTQHFLLLSLTTILIAAAGYILNDLYDRRIDQINKPDAVIVGRFFSVKTALFFYILLNVAALAMALWLGLLLQKPLLGLIQMSCILLLWLYAARLKKTAVWGNAVVSVLIALTIVVVVAFEPSTYHLLKQPFQWHFGRQMVVNPILVIAVYTYFALMTTWMREIVKDMQDAEGDKALGCRTLPIVAGFRPSGRMVQILGLLTLIPLCVVTVWSFHGRWLFMAIYILVTLIMPLTRLCFHVLKEQTPSHFAQQSRHLKFLMLWGVLSLLLYGLLTIV